LFNYFLFFPWVIESQNTCASKQHNKIVVVFSSLSESLNRKKMLDGLVIQTKLLFSLLFLSH